MNPIFDFFLSSYENKETFIILLEVIVFIFGVLSVWFAKKENIFWLDHLYVRPDAQDFGVGLRLLDHVKTQGPHGFQLWCFQANAGARRFYERQGLTLAKMTDGSDNEEKLPDALYLWHGEKTPGKDDKR